LTSNVGDKYRQDGQNRNPSRAFFRSIIPPMLVTSQADTDLPDSSTQNPLGQHNRSSTSILLSHSIIKRTTWYSQGRTCTMGARMLTSRKQVMKQMMGLFQGKNLYRVLRVRPLAVRSRMLRVGVMHLMISSCSECRSGPDLQTGNQSRNQSHTDAGEIDPEEHETLRPPTRQNLQEPEPHSRSSNTQMGDVRVS